VDAVIGPRTALDAFTFSARVQLHFSHVLEPIGDRVRNGDFELLKTLLNAVAKVAPSRRPVLVVREVTRVDQGPDSQTFARLLASLETAKQETREGAASLQFPVFLETSDFAWLSSPQRVNSPRSFQTFLIPPIEENVAREELVQRHKLLTSDEFRLVWSEFGGHGGSIEAVCYQRRLSGSLSSAITAVSDAAYSQVRNAVQGSVSGDQILRQEYLGKLKAANHSMLETTLAKSLFPLFDQNVLFFYADLVVPQNLALQLAIDRFLSNLSKAC